MGVTGGIEIILNMREKMAEMQHQMEAFTTFVQQDCPADSSRGPRANNALARVSPRRQLRPQDEVPQINTDKSEK